MWLKELPSLWIVGLYRCKVAQVLCMGVAVGNVGMNADELRSAFTATVSRNPPFRWGPQRQNAGRTAWWPSTSWSLCWRKTGTTWSGFAQETRFLKRIRGSSLWISNILGLFCPFFCLLFFVYFHWTLMTGFRYAMWRKGPRGTLHVNLPQGACTSKVPWGRLLIQSWWQCKWMHQLIQVTFILQFPGCF